LRQRRECGGIVLVSGLLVRSDSIAFDTPLLATTMAMIGLVLPKWW